MKRTAKDWIKQINADVLYHTNCDLELSCKDGDYLYDILYNSPLDDIFEDSKFDVCLVADNSEELTENGDPFWYIFNCIDSKTKESVYIKFQGVYDKPYGGKWDNNCFFVYPQTFAKTPLPKTL